MWTDLLLLVRFSPLLDDDDQIFLTLFLELGHFAPGDRELLRHLLHLLPGLIDLIQPILQLGGLLPQLGALLMQETGENIGMVRLPSIYSIYPWRMRLEDPVSPLVSGHHLQVAGRGDVVLSFQF